MNCVNRQVWENDSKEIRPEAVKRNKNLKLVEEFKSIPEDFMFQLTDEEFEDLQSQNVTANISKRRTSPYGFSQNGVAMLSSVLRSKHAYLQDLLDRGNSKELKKIGFVTD